MGVDVLVLNTAAADVVVDSLAEVDIAKVVELIGSGAQPG